MIDDYDGAEPTASSIAAANLIRLSGLVPLAAQSTLASPGPGSQAPAPSEDYLGRACRVLEAFGERLADNPLAIPKMCCSAHLLKMHEAMRQIIVAGSASAPETQALISAAHSAALAPDKVVILIDLEDDGCVRFFEDLNPDAVAMVKRHFSSHPGETSWRCSSWGANWHDGNCRDFPD